MKKLSFVFFAWLLVIKSYAGFDVGGGPGISLERIVDFFKDAQKYLVEGTLRCDNEEGKLRLSSVMKNNVSLDSSEFWSKTIQSDDQNNFMVLILGRNLDPKLTATILVEFDNFDLEKGDLVFDLMNHAKTYRLDIKNKEVEKIELNSLYRELCSHGTCPNLHFISIK